MSQIGIAGPDGRVSLWCDVINRREDGTIEFDVINGAWAGTISPAGDVWVEHTNRTFRGNKIVWEGKAPFLESEYNEAIRWIEEQCA